MAANPKKYGITLDGKEYVVLVREIIETQPITGHVEGIGITKALYNGSQIRPTVITDGTIVENQDYIISYGTNTNVGPGTVTVSGIGNYTGSETFSFDILTNQISAYVVSTTESSYTYTGSPIKPSIITSSEIEQDVDYVLSYENNVEIGTGIAKVTGIGRYTGTANLPFEIAPGENHVSYHVFGVDPETSIYTGEEIKPSIIDDGVMEADTDYTLTYANNIEIGTGTVTVTGKGDYVGTASFDFEIVTNDIEEYAFGIEPTVALYTGSGIEPEVYTDTIVERDTDFTVSYENNIEIGTGTVKVTGIGKCTGEASFTFQIVTNNIAEYATGIEPTSAVYTGEEIKPTVLFTVNVEPDTDYTVEYANNIEVGEGSVTVTGIGKYTGTETFTFAITEAPEPSSEPEPGSDEPEPPVE